MALIRQANAFEAARNAIPLDLADVERQAQEIEARAHARSQEIIKQANAERQQLIADAEDVGRETGTEQGRSEGFKKGCEEGRAQAHRDTEAQLTELIERWQAALDEFNNDREALIESARRDLLRLAIDIAERITKHTIDTSPHPAAKQLEAALDRVLDPSALRIETHPDDADTCEQTLPKLHTALTATTHTTIIRNESLPPGSVLIRTRAGVIDASIDTQLDAIAHAILGEARGKASNNNTSARPKRTDHHQAKNDPS